MEKSFLEWFFKNKENKEDESFWNTFDKINIRCSCGAKFRYNSPDINTGQILAGKFIEAHRGHADKTV